MWRSVAFSMVGALQEFWQQKTPQLFCDVSVIVFVLWLLRECIACAFSTRAMLEAFSMLILLVVFLRLHCLRLFDSNGNVSSACGFVSHALWDKDWLFVLAIFVVLPLVLLWLLRA